MLETIRQDKIGEKMHVREKQKHQCRVLTGLRPSSYFPKETNTQCDSPAAPAPLPSEKQTGSYSAIMSPKSTPHKTQPNSQNSAKMIQSLVSLNSPKLRGIFPPGRVHAGTASPWSTEWSVRMGLPWRLRVEVTHGTEWAWDSFCGDFCERDTC